SVQTIFHSGDNEYHLQEFFVKHRAQIPITSVEYRGAESARVNPELKEVIRKAKLIIIGPSNPVSSIGPILFPEMRRIIQKTSVPKMVISPIIGDKTVSGPAKKYMMELGYDSSPTGIVNYYDDVANVFVFHVTDRNENLARKYPEKRIFFKNILFSDKKDLKNLTLWIDEVAERPNSLELC
ncbi:MAG TPA: 2-phospho-L-lactate transferase CofD family protein, partial [Candidatus Hodarchaeales archaeon]|nr:2-phospho-L-lactate transferase CofD family protein [Candidatus Hodarchaeales archaeon]